jgi:hypothetical protein
MLSLLLITTLAVQYPQASKPATDTTAPRRSTQAAPRGTSQSAIGRQAFHDRMRELWTDHVAYTRNFIISASAGLPDTAEVAQRLLRNQDEIGESVRPYYGDAAATQLSSLLRNHIQLAAKTLIAAKGTSTAMSGMNMQDTRMADTVSTSAQYPNTAARMNDTTRIRPGVSRSDSTQAKTNAQYPPTTGRMNDTTRARQGNARVTGDTISQRLPANQYARPDTTQKNAQGYVQNRDYASSQSQISQTAQVDSNALNQAITALKANGDSIAIFLASANPRGFARETLRGALQMHITLLLKEATAQIQKDWSGSIAAFDESERQAWQMADLLSDGIMKQFPSRFSNKATTVSSR